VSRARADWKRSGRVQTLSLCWGLCVCRFSPRLTPWAAFLRRFATEKLAALFDCDAEILVLTFTLKCCSEVF
jgi:hypothetical protein